MISFVAFILQLPLLQHSASQEIPVFKPSYRILDGEEPTTKMPVVKDFDKETIDSPLLGLLYAGKTEFNWIVDIRMEDQDQEHWSIGNLVTYFHVLTTCRAVTKVEAGQMKVHSRVTMYYSQSYLFPQQEETKYSAGKRDSKEIIPHTNCKPDSLLYDFALIRMSQEVRPDVPLVGYMPVFVTAHRDLSLFRGETNICHVAAYGRRYRNIQTESFNIVRDFKIKFRVYFLDHTECEKYYDKICGSQRSVCDQASDKKNLDKLICVRPRKRVGAICDHHRGAPFVCNDLVRGIVIRGVGRDHCHSLLQYPVLVLRTSDYINDLYDRLTAKKLGDNFLAERSSCSLNRPNSFLLVAIAIRWIVVYRNLPIHVQ